MKFISHVGYWYFTMHFIFFNHPTSIKWFVSWTAGNRLLKPLCGEMLDWLNFGLGEIVGLIHATEKDIIKIKHSCAITLAQYMFLWRNTQNYPLIITKYCNDPKFSDRHAWANSADPPRGAVWSGSTLFAILSASFGLIILWQSHIGQILEWLQQIFGVSEYLGNLRYPTYLFHCKQLPTLVMEFSTCTSKPLAVRNYLFLTLNTTKSQGPQWNTFYSSSLIPLPLIIDTISDDKKNRSR